jgi:acyl CoA:acetate/3-ketoacid CoA transferase alpha subunit/acyl CoA:acetate/3-ketoacid CoA transferase beta subunit
VDEEVKKVLKDLSVIEEDEGENKVVSLEEAIKANIRPGISLYISENANAAVREIVRQFWGTKPKFTLISAAVTDQALNLIHGRLVERVITTICSLRGPSCTVQRAYENRTVEFENWSLLTLTQRLMAGAFGLGFAVTKSNIGSSMAIENKESFLVVDDPFGNKEQFALVKALNPSIAVVHGLASDCYGNTIIAPSPATGHAAWGAKASKGGIIVTVERLVPTNSIRKYAALVKIPGYMVKAVAVTPFGAHPQGLINCGINEFEPYKEDRDFTLDYKRAEQNLDTLDSWIANWVLSPRTHEEYLLQLGAERLFSLRGKAGMDAWLINARALAQQLDAEKECTPSEMQAIAAANRLTEIVLKKNYRIILCGIGIGALATYVAYYMLRKSGFHVDLVIGSGFFGVLPRPCEQELLDISNLMNCKIFADVIEAYGVWIGGSSDKCISVLGGAQIDKCGNINSTKTPQLYLLGSGGSNDAVNAAEVLAVIPQDRGRFLDKVHYITCPGQRVKTLVSTMGVFEKLRTDEEFTLVEYFAGLKGSDPGKQIKEIKDNCGWDLKVSPAIKATRPPSLEQLVALRLFTH